MKVIRAEIIAQTASFRYPMFIVGYQPTFKVPPISTIYGLLSAAKGEIVTSHDVRVGFDFTSNGSGNDLEKIYELAADGNVSKGNVITREFLYDCKLTLYISDLDFSKHLKNPYYTLLLGRQSDLAFVRSIKTIELEKSDNVSINNTIIPFDGSIPGQIITLPTGFTNEFHRKPCGIRTFVFIESSQNISGYYDTERECGVFMHPEYT